MKTVQVVNTSAANESGNKIAIMRSIKAPSELDKDELYLDNGAGPQRFELDSLHSRYTVKNKLYEISYAEITDNGVTRKKVFSWAQPTLEQVVAFNGFSFSDEYAHEVCNNFWAEPIINIESVALFDTVAGLQMLLARCNKYIEERQFCIAKPSCFCDFAGILNVVDSVTFDSQLNKDIAIAGAYLFCVHRSYFAVKSEGKDVSNFDHDILNVIENSLKKLANESPELASNLRQFIRLSELNRTDDLTKFSAESVFVKDCYEALQPALNRARRISMQRQAMGLCDY